MIKISNKTYDVLKFIMQIILPAIASSYFALSAIWKLPYSEEIVGTISVITAFLGTVLKLSSDTYYAYNKKEKEESYE